MPIADDRRVGRTYRPTISTWTGARHGHVLTGGLLTHELKATETDFSLRAVPADGLTRPSGSLSRSGRRAARGAQRLCGDTRPATASSDSAPQSPVLQRPPAQSCSSTRARAPSQGSQPEFRCPNDRAHCSPHAHPAIAICVPSNPTTPSGFTTQSNPIDRADSDPRPHQPIEPVTSAIACKQRSGRGPGYGRSGTRTAPRRRQTRRCYFHAEEPRGPRDRFRWWLSGKSCGVDRGALRADRWPRDRYRECAFAPVQAARGAIRCWWRRRRLWVAVMSRHSERTADLPRRWNR